jgi:hypothetical protein
MLLQAQTREEMTMQEQKKLWQQPELIVLVRNRPEEAVLIVCKGAGPVQASDSAWGSCLEDLSMICGEPCQGLYLS